MNKKILVIEDEKAISDNLRILLENEDFIVETASNGNDGLNKSYSFNPDLIICDIMMPDRDGYSILETLTKDKTIGLTPFIFLTAKVEKADLRKGMNLGADDYIFKPYDADDLLTTIRTRLQKYELIKVVIEEKEGNKNQEVKKDGIIFRMGDDSYPVNFKKILYISAERQYSNIFTVNKKKYVIKKSLNQWEEILPASSFVRVHRAAIVNLDYVNKIDRDSPNHYKVHINDSEKTIEVSRRFYKNIKSYKI